MIMDHDDVKMIVYCNNSFRRSKISEVYSKNQNAVILIGPEGDFSDDEIQNATGKGFTQVHLRLRNVTGTLFMMDSPGC